jgi:tRNA(Ile)-lysidine synthase
MNALGHELPPQRIALALSGGGDSVALMYLLGNWARASAKDDEGLQLHALIVDHGLREGAGRDAKRAALLAREAGWRAHILKWKGDKPKSNIEDAARAARYTLLGQWCKAHKTRTLFVAHTRDDLAETFLLRLGRGSGVDGLSAMRARAPFPVPAFRDVELLRPLLGFERGELRDYLTEQDAAWIEDPMNADPRYSRVRVRALLPRLEEAGISSGRIAAAAHHLARARVALDAQADAFLDKHSKSIETGTVLLDAAALACIPHEMGLRALSAVLARVGGNPYRARFERLEALYSALSASVQEDAPFRARTLAGCRIGRAPKRNQVFGTATLEVKAEGPRKTPR